MAKQGTGSILSSISLNASRERMTELLSDFKRLNIEEPQPKVAENDRSITLAVSNSAENEDSIELGDYHQSDGKFTALYVGDLDPAVTEEKLYHFFSNYKSLSTVKICTSPTTKASRGYGYVNFESEKDAQRAIEELNYMPLMSREIRIMPSLKGQEKSFLGTNVFLSNVNTQKIKSLRSFYDTFKSYGTILSCKLDLPKRQGFISFKDRTTAEHFVTDMNKTILFGLKIHCGLHVPRSLRSKAFNPGSTPSTASTLQHPSNDKNSHAFSASDFDTKPSIFASRELSTSSTVYAPQSNSSGKDITSSASAEFDQIYVKGLPLDITEADLKDLFSKCGVISDIYLQHVKEFKSSWAMITFCVPDSAAHATREFHRMLFRGKKLTCVKALTKAERRLQLSFKSPAVSLHKSKHHQKLYLYNLPPTVNENFFKLFLRNYSLEGTIIRFFIGPKAESSFIDFEKEEDAKSACLMLNGIDIAGYKLRASLTKLEDSAIEGANPNALKPDCKTYGDIKTPSSHETIGESRASSVAFSPSTFVYRPSRVAVSPALTQDVNYGGFYRLIPVQMPYNASYSRDFECLPAISRKSSIRDTPDILDTLLPQLPLLSVLENVAPRYIDFMKYPTATRPRNLRRILQYFIDLNGRDDQSAIKNQLERIQKGDMECEGRFREQLSETIELLGFGR